MTALADNVLYPFGASAAGASVAVVIVTFNSADALPALLDSLVDGLEGVDRFEVIVVDNDSKDGSAEIAQDHPLRPTVIRTGRNAGYAAAINIASRRANAGAHLLILNPDLRLYPGAVKPLIEQVATSKVGVVVPLNYKEDGSIDPTLRREPSIITAWADSILGGNLAARLGLGEIVGELGQYDRRRSVQWATGSALLVTSEVRKIVGAWDESFFLYSEEVDYQRRIREAGYDIVYEPRSKVMHAGGGSGTGPRLFALLTANRIRYYRRHHGALRTSLFKLGVAIGHAARSWRGASHRAALVGALAPLRSAAAFLESTRG
ncbi:MULTISPECIES: glycosyltransferase family 2 protein [Rhizobium]|uniref:Family 2 glycosyl transferase n=1 Tax=Rhizobium favelukesii TaxID=348824 RepID=W6RLC0_9HYPH|nr:MULTISPECIES: glycosyltransferase family 2 protein [Rhizobium]MCA0804737.1 glycosyltransferase family 2 protein [Rhizobium sp. T1473]MCS0458012.1 glycosyltransferase family 2 protein [Rhizobium favelukesii]UFS79881.1 glycosyltransferase family 2 protein [Rhizobium sp. T136]CDM61594.1 family 2 glycosyl transferase [Rhizobium favelukesii]